ncbi:MAG TPA: S8 family serine peptidase [Gemmatimonadaceae bacterium]|nr:S8 family serine peptidase [Gemmatimonadaceae bacterium]
MSDAELASKISEAGGRVFIGFKDPGLVGGVDERGRVRASAASVVAAKAELRALGVAIVFEFIDMPTVVARMSAALLPQLRQNPLVEYIEPIFPGVRHAQTTTWNVDRVNAPAAWPSSTGSGAKLLIIDSGIENTHPDLAPAVVQSCESPPTDGLDVDGHGTNVSGVAAAVNNDIQIVGVAHGVSLWTSKDGNASPNPDYTACGIQFGRVNGVHAINISSSFPPHTAVTDQINAAYHQNGIVIVVSAGNTNGGAVTYPATLDAAIAVSATDINNNFASFSAMGSKVELAAPGAGITTTCLGGITCSVNGTSFSAPHVAAAAALLKAYNSRWSNVEIRRRLGAGATDLGAAGRDAQFGYGLLNITGAIAADPPASPPPLSVSIDGPTQIQPGATCTWYAAVGNGTPPYSYQWTASQMAPPSGTDYYFTASKDAGSFATSWPLKVVVTDAVGGSGEHEITVYEDPSAFTCTI